MPSCRDALVSLAVPTVVVAGERDERFAGIARDLAGTWRAARAIVVPGVGHDVVLEAPGVVAELLAEASGGGS
jgi:pimeloyl-ACP methyl ester carboxylesterase